MNKTDIIVKNELLMARAAQRFPLDQVVKASIIGSKNKEEFLAKDVSHSGVLIKYLNKSIPFREGTIIELEFPLDILIQRENSSIRLLGKVVRVETESEEQNSFKTHAGIKLLMNDAKEAKVWRMIMGMLSNKTSQKQAA